jgi:NET1-associated nuclear protein 1 (U3 small nucleolar RNA-associated protein 17)
MPAGQTAGGVLTHYPVVFSADGKFFFVICHDQIKVHSVQTTETLSELDHPHAVTGCATNPVNCFQLITTSIDGIVRVWEYQEAVILSECDTGVPIIRSALSANLDDPGLCLCCSEQHHYYEGRLKPTNDAVSLIWYNVKSQQTGVKLYRGRVKTGPGSGVVISHDSTVAAWITKKELCVLRLDTAANTAGNHQVKDKRAKSNAPRPRSLAYKHKFTTVAFHPHDCTVATGHENGMIVLWYLNAEFLQNNQTEKPVTAVLHWHASAVTSLAFSIDGTNMLSGGHEAVLVTWQLATRNRSFLPRLGGTINSISVSPLKADTEPTYALCLDNNTISLVSAVSGQVYQNLRGVSTNSKGDKPKGKKKKRRNATSFVFEPRRRLVTMAGRPGALQFYDRNRDRHASEVEVVPYNTVYRGSEASQKGHGHVIEHVAFSSDGNWMITVDRRAQLDMDEQSSLKFWRWHDSASSESAPDGNQASATVNGEGHFALDTTMEEPHKAVVTALCHHPTQAMAVTTSEDFTFKVWALQDLGHRKDFGGEMKNEVRSAY